MIIITGTGKRVAESYNGDQAGAPLLRLEYIGGPPNIPPQAVDDDPPSTDEDTAFDIDVAANDSDPDGSLNPASINTACAGCSDPVYGSLTKNVNDTFKYTPNPNYNGSDSFVYEICDTRGGCDTALVSITINPVADPPVANDDNQSTPVDTPVIIDVSANDSDPDSNLDPNSANTTCIHGSTGCSNPSNGSLVNNGNGIFEYTPNTSFTGSDTFNYEICDSGSLCDTATVTITVQDQASVIYLSSTTSGTVDGIAFKDEDILAFDTTNGSWSMYFDGSDVGLEAGSQEISALHINSDGSILLSLGAAGTIPDVGSVDDFDILRFIPSSLGDNTAGTYELYFDGEDVGLTGEDIDAIGFAPDGRLVISLRGSFDVGGVSGRDEDLLIFTATSLGSTTSGTWDLYFDGSDVALDTASSEDVNATWIDSNGDIYMSVKGAFSVAGVDGDGADIFTCVPGSTGDITSCTFNLFWDGSVNSFAGEVINGFHIGQ